MDTIQDIKHAFYINLSTRPDRKEHVETQLQNIGITANRFNAIKLTNGAIGCSMSHLKCVETAKKMGWSHVLIVEDDIQFLKPEQFVSQFSKFLSTHKNWDVVLLGGNNIPPYQRVDDTCIRVGSCQTTTGYIVKSHYYDTLIANFREGIKQLMLNPLQHVVYAIDKYWFQLQRRDRWYLITPLTVTQREDYSDIEKRAINYRNAMLDLDKESYIKAITQPVYTGHIRPQLNLFQDIK